MEGPEGKSIMEIILLDTFCVATCCTKERIQRTVAALLRWLQTPAFPSLAFFLPLSILSLYPSPSLSVSLLVFILSEKLLVLL